MKRRALCPPFLTMSTKKTKGIVLFAFGKRGYFFAAYNLALSVKHFNPEIPVVLFYNGDSLKYLSNLSVFDDIYPIKDEDIYRNGKIDPARLKTNIYKYLPYDENLYLDVDGLALKDLQPLIDHLSKQKGWYLTDVTGVGGKGDKINYAIWASQEKIWEFFKLKSDAQYPAIQSSFAYIKKTKTAEKFFNKVYKNYELDFPVRDLKMQWGGTIPDELLFSVTCAQSNIVPRSNCKPIFFGWVLSNKTYGQIKDQHYLTAIYGNGNGRTLTRPRYLKWYDNLLRSYALKEKKPYYKTSYIMQDKHANNR
jgi:hypothetical protein